MAAAERLIVPGKYLGPLGTSKESLSLMRTIGGNRYWIA